VPKCEISEVYKTLYLGGKSDGWWLDSVGLGWLGLMYYSRKVKAVECSFPTSKNSPNHACPTLGGMSQFSAFRLILQLWENILPLSVILS
jgi:hypothetical protein